MMQRNRGRRTHRRPTFSNIPAVSTARLLLQVRLLEVSRFVEVDGGLSPRQPLEVHGVEICPVEVGTRYVGAFKIGPGKHEARIKTWTSQEPKPDVHSHPNGSRPQVRAKTRSSHHHERRLSSDFNQGGRALVRALDAPQKLRALPAGTLLSGTLATQLHIWRGAP